VHYHTKGEFQPIQPPPVTHHAFQAYTKEENIPLPEQPYVAAGSESQSPNIAATTDSEIVHAITESPWHQSTDNATHVDEAYVSPAQEHVEKEQEREIPYNAWDART
jgi:hypothetical protein